MNAKIVTRSLLESLGACCYDNGHQAGELEVDRAVGEGVDEMSLADALALGNVDQKDKIWLGIQFLSNTQQIVFACDCAERVQRFWRKQYPGVTVFDDLLVTCRRFVEGDATNDCTKAAFERAHQYFLCYNRAGGYRVKHAALAALDATSEVWIHGRVDAYAVAELTSGIFYGAREWQLTQLKERLK